MLRLFGQRASHAYKKINGRQQDINN